MQFLQMTGELMHTTIVFATALVFASLGALYSERAGVANIALEGLMTVGAFTAAIVTYFVETQLGGGAVSPWIGFAAAVAAGTIFAVPHAVASVTYKADQIVSGVALNFLAIGITIYLCKVILHGAAQTPTLKAVFTKWDIPFLSEIPFLGHAVFSAYPTSYLAFMLVAVSVFVLYKTPFGLRLRAVGEHPKAADSMAISVSKMRYMAVMISGALAAMGGATVTLTTTSNFSHSTISGQGYIALAALIFGKWRPVAGMCAALFFGIASALKSVFQVHGITDYIPVDFIYIFPYALTILVLAGFVGRAVAPAALGKPYEKGQR
ncbi:inner membrane ABC transporter permease protein YjfF [Paenibacillus konkukensis]|uniref:Inner membrane ABC transporter permease protein YjfF n=1 Tax=Paenibacillus konkukensis TaxID=2020716 RepID=A0ABY4RK21_9BACL|nr:ABC transporter permease [Paenibacillus konkukensis]UQZ82370.1 inner membrane ABC transporter permease protein YjfF [Paenibacillus konkukensis]